MGSRRKKKTRAAPAPPSPREAAPLPVVAAPFHSPFRELARSIQVRPKPPAPRPVVTRPAALPVASPGPPPSPAPSDAEILAASLAGVSPLVQPPARVRIRRKVDLSSIDAARQADLDALARGEGFDLSYEDRYVRGRAAGVSRETLSRLEKGEFRICAHLDLHGLPLEDARKEVDVFLAAQQKRGHRCVLLVTGKGKNSPGGTGVLREQVPAWLARGPSSRRVLAFASARPCDGGLGALVVLMRGSSSSKNRIDVEHGGVGRIES